MGRKCAHVKEITELIVECRSRGKGGLKCCTVDRTDLVSHERPSDMDNKFCITQKSTTCTYSCGHVNLITWHIRFCIYIGLMIENCCKCLDKIIK